MLAGDDVPFCKAEEAAFGDVASKVLLFCETRGDVKPLKGDSVPRILQPRKPPPAGALNLCGASLSSAAARLELDVKAEDVPDCCFECGSVDVVPTHELELCGDVQ